MIVAAFASAALYAGVPYHQTMRPSAAPAKNLSALRSIRQFPRPEREVQHCEREDHALPDGEMKRVEPRALVTADQIQRDDANEVCGLDDRGSGRNGCGARSCRRGEGENC